MEPVCPDDGGVPADRRYSYAEYGFLAGGVDGGSGGGKA